jgi:putative tryptophan/tyrosine transport system substrate-binding protein
VTTSITRRELVAGLAGGLLALPISSRAEQRPVPLIGFMSSRSPEDTKHLVAAFRQGLEETGFVEGRNVVIEYRWADGQYDRLPAIAADLVSRRVAVLLGLGGEVSAVAAKQATSTIPIVFGIGGDPIKVGLVESFNRPGGNATGFTLLSGYVMTKRLGLLHDLVPDASVVGVLSNPNFPAAAQQLKDITEAAQTTGQHLFVVNASNDAELESNLLSLLQQPVGALLVTADPYFDTRRDQIIAFAAQHRLPAIYQFREYAVAGGLTSYGPSTTDAYRQAGIYAGRILKGAKPADLPVLQPTKFEFVINLKTAKALGLTIPSGPLSIADEVIE